MVFNTFLNDFFFCVEQISVHNFVVDKAFLHHRVKMQLTGFWK